MQTLQLDLTKRYTFADYLTWLDSKRRELIDGFIQLMSPAPARVHQDLSGELFYRFKTYLKRKRCKVYHAPFDVRLPVNGEKSDNEIYTVVQPDICVICDPAKLDDKGCIGAPDLIIEILSPSSSKHDSKTKYSIYEKAGVIEFWLVYPAEKVVHIYHLNPVGKYEQSGIYAQDDKIPVGIFNGDLIVDLAEVFEIEEV